MDCQPNTWDGSALGSGPLSLFLCGSAPSAPGARSEVMFGAASDGEGGFGLLREQLSSFLRRHEDRTLVCYAAANLHWLLHDLFEGSGDQDAMRVLWTFSEDARLADVGLLDQHVRRIGEEGTTPGRLTLSRLIERYTGDHFPGARSFRQAVGDFLPATYQEFDQSRLILPIRAALGLATTYMKLVSAARRLEDVARTAKASHRPEPVPLPTILPPRRPSGARSQGDPEKPFSDSPGDGFTSPRELGVLGVGLDVMGEIALGQARRLGMIVDPDGKLELGHRCERMYVQASKALHADSTAKKEIEWDHDRIARDQSGKPRFGRALNRTLERKRRDLFDATGYDPLLPRSITGDWSEAHAGLGIWPRCDDDLQAWCDLLGAADVARFGAGDAAGAVSPDFHVQPTIYSSRPNLEVINDMGGPVFRPRDGHMFLVVQLPELKLRCLATLCRDWYGSPAASLYPVFSTVDNPVHVLADELYRRSRHRGAGAAGPNLESVQRDQPDEYRRWCTLTLALLEVLPLGLPFELAQSVLDREYGLGRLPRGEWEGLAKLLVRNIALELRNFTDYDPGRVVAENQATSESQVRRQLGLGHWLNVYNRPRHDPTPSRAWKELGGGRPGHEDPGDTRALRAIRAGIGGRLTSQWYLAEVHRQAWDFLVGDTLKSVAYALVANGFRLLAVVREELLMEIQIDHANNTREIQSACDQAARKLLRGAAPSCRIFACPRWPATGGIAPSTPPSRRDGITE